MAGRRKYARKGVRKYKKRSYNRKRRYSGHRRNSKIHYFTRTVMDEFSVLATGFRNENTMVMNSTVRLADLDNVQEYKDLFDSYKIKGIQKKFIFNRNAATAGQQTIPTQMPHLIIVRDTNDNSALANLEEAMQYQSFKSKVLSCDYPVSIYFRPVPSLAYRNRWLSTSADSSVTMYGLKVATDSAIVAGGPEIGILRVYTKYYMSFKSVI